MAKKGGSRGRGRRSWAVWVFCLAAAVRPAAASDWEEVKRRGTLRAVTEDDISMAFENELMDGFVKLHGLKLEMVRNKALAERIPALLSGEADVALALFDTAERRKVVGFTTEVLPTVYTIATCQPGLPVTSVQELPRRRVGVLGGSIMEGAAQRAGVAAENIVGFPEITALIEALCGGKVSAALVAVPDLAAFRPRFPKLEYGAPMEQVMSAAWAVRQQDVHLKAALDDYLTNIRRSGGWNRIVVKHFGAEALKVLGRAAKP